MMYRKINYLLGISAIAIVISHANLFGLNSLLAWTAQYKSVIPINFDPTKTFQYYFLIFGTQFFFFAVPAFFFVSGFFISYAIDKTGKTIQWNTIKNRVLALLVPYLFWSIITIVTDAFIGILRSPAEYIQHFILGIPGFWFVPVIITFYLVTPWFLRILHYGEKKIFIFLAVLQILLIVCKYAFFGDIKNPFFHLLFSDYFNETIFNWIIFFPLGILLGTHLSQLSLILQKYRGLLITIFIICFLLPLAINELTNAVNVLNANWVTCFVQMMNQCYSIAAILLFLSIDDKRLIFSKQILKLSGRSYGIYLTHYMFIFYYSKIIYHFLPIFLSQQLLFTFSNILIGLGGALLLMVGVKRTFLRSYYPYLFG